MTMTLLTDANRITAAVLLISVPTIAFGGTFLLRIARGTEPATDMQRSFFRAGHAHAGVLVLFALVALLYIDAAGVHGMPARLARTLIPAAPILIPAGFFLSMAGRGRTTPNRLILLVYAGALSLAVGVVVLGIAVIP